MDSGNEPRIRSVYNIFLLRLISKISTQLGNERIKVLIPAWILEILYKTNV